MKIALTSHNYWPYFRRGSSRHIHNLAMYLLKQGHQVHIITSKPGAGKSLREGNLRITYHPYLAHPLLLNYRIERFHGFIYSTLRSLLAEESDVVYSMFHTDGFAAGLAGLLRRKKMVLNISTVPFRDYWRGRAMDEFMFKHAARSAAHCVMPSLFARRCMEKDYGISGNIVPMSVDLSHFRPSGNNGRKGDTILFASAAYDHRKGTSLLLAAFEQVKKEVPSAVLRIASPMPRGYEEDLRRRIPPSIRSSVEILGARRLADLPALYAESAVTVLPSLQEVFGMVLIESLACGTPVVGSRSGAIPEILTDDEIGALFDPLESEGFPTNASGLSEAILRALELSKKPGTPLRCRRHAEEYSVEKVGSAFERLFQSV
jgi:phosphatidylinositol alpha-mannosyltransferase